MCITTPLIITLPRLRLSATLTLALRSQGLRTGDNQGSSQRPDGRARLYGREAVGHRVGRPARDQVKEGVARLAQHLELELDLAVQ